MRVEGGKKTLKWLYEIVNEILGKVSDPSTHNSHSTRHIHCQHMPIENMILVGKNILSVVMLMRCKNGTEEKETVKEKPSSFEHGVKTPSVLTCGPAAIKHRRSEDISKLYLHFYFASFSRSLASEDLMSLGEPKVLFAFSSTSCFVSSSEYIIRYLLLSYMCALKEKRREMLKKKPQWIIYQQETA